MHRDSEAANLEINEVGDDVAIEFCGAGEFCSRGLSIILHAACGQSLG
jgi:hypothetical protein